MTTPRAEDVRELRRHRAFADSHSPPELRRKGQLLGVGALKQLDGRHAELKSMHTAQAARGRGIGRAMVDHLVGIARDRGFRRVSIETGSMPAFAPARSLYANAGFRPCGPFGGYRPSRNSTFMTLSLNGPDSAGLTRPSVKPPKAGRAEPAVISTGPFGGDLVPTEPPSWRDPTQLTAGPEPGH